MNGPALAWNVWDKRMPINFNKPTVKPSAQETNFFVFFAPSEPNVRMFGQPSGVSIQFLSDTHLDHLLYQHVPIQPAAPILLVIGDIGRFDDYDQYRDFLIHHSARFEKLLPVAGNHEFYSSSRTQGLEAAERLIREPKMNGKLVFLNRGRFDMPDTDITVLGCTLHSHIASLDYNKLTHDFARIKEWRVADHNREHEKDLPWLENSIAVCSKEQPQRKIVVATHYAPAFERTTHPANENNAIS
ncbi:hypothetical protein D0862_01353 [Hortaea werneckii]|uniref:Calcineurin-like phosphoesterase domain-containing protein n=1 Tax=Hortaea werneckii TaxID=91943 RepID=A0A3M7HT27_HORWE|nr:hypothetical protein D0862_01353 [Hortaea werneckii]